MIVSPCISICKTDPVSGLCYGCGRSDEEKKIWKDPETTDDWKNNNLKEIENRLSGWQLESFKMSYKNKIENIKAPEIAINYWNLPLNSRLKDVVKVIRDDEAGHRDVNHSFADILNTKKNKVSNEEANYKDKEKI